MFSSASTPIEPDALRSALRLQPVNANVHSVHLADGRHAGNLKRVGAIWKFKAIGHDAAGRVEPGKGPLTHQHNMVFAQPDATEASAWLVASRATKNLL